MQACPNCHDRLCNAMGKRTYLCTHCHTHIHTQAPSHQRAPTHRGMHVWMHARSMPKWVDAAPGLRMHSSPLSEVRKCSSPPASCVQLWSRSEEAGKQATRSHCRFCKCKPRSLQWEGHTGNFPGSSPVCGAVAQLLWHASVIPFYSCGRQAGGLTEAGCGGGERPLHPFPGYLKPVSAPRRGGGQSKPRTGPGDSRSEPPGGGRGTYLGSATRCGGANSGRCSRRRLRALAKDGRAGKAAPPPAPHSLEGKRVASQARSRRRALEEELLLLLRPAA